MKTSLKGTWAIFTDGFFDLVRTKRAIVIIVAYLSLMLIGMKIGSLFEALSWAFIGSRKSFSIMLPFYVSVVLLPLFSIVIGYNAVSEETSSGSIKFLAYRTNRFSILLGKILSAFLLSVFMILIAYIIALFYVHSKVGLWFSLHYLISWLYLSVYSLCFVCLAIAISTLSKTPSMSMVWSLLASILFLVMLNYNYLKFASPFYFSDKALDYVINGLYLDMLLGFCVLLLHSLVYFALSYAVFQRSDLC